MYLLTGNGKVGQHSITRKHRIELIRMVQNAYYDVTRYPGHVATHSQANASGEMQRVNTVMKSKAAGWGMRSTQFSLAAFTVALVMPTARMFQEPQVCKTIVLVRDMVTELHDETLETMVTDPWVPHERRLHDNYDAQLKTVSERFQTAHGCQFQRAQEAEGFLTEGFLTWFLLFSSPAWLAPSVIMVLSVLAWIALRCGRTEPYRVIVACMLRVYPVVRPHVPTVMYNSLDKPEECDLLVSPLQIWRRLMHPVYLIAYWFADCILLLTVCYVHSDEHRLWCQLMVLVLIRAYFPAMTLMLGAMPDLAAIIDWELSNTYVANFKGDGDSKEGSKREQLPGSMHGANYTDCLFKVSHEWSKTDVWHRLLHCKSSTFTCSMSELYVLMQYFEFCHMEKKLKDSDGKEIEGKRWLIDWHKRLELQDQGPIQEVFLDDYGLLLHSAADDTETCATSESEEDQRQGSARIAQQLSLGSMNMAKKFAKKLQTHLTKEQWSSEVRGIVNGIVDKIDKLHKEAEQLRAHKDAEQSEEEEESADDDAESRAPLRVS